MEEFMMLEKKASIDLPWEKTFSYVNYDKYDPDFCRKTPSEMIRSKIENHPSWIAYDFYGKQITNLEFQQNCQKGANAYRNLGIKRDDLVFMLCTNTPEMVYSMYGLNDLGSITEWFNPLAISPELLRKYLNDSNVKYVFAIDVMYPVLKEAILGTKVERVIINSVKDSFPLKMNVLYDAQVFGINSLLNTKYFQHEMKKIRELIPSKQELLQTTNLSELKKYQMLLMKIKKYADSQKLNLKASYYLDENKDTRFLSWQELMSSYSSKDKIEPVPYEDGKTSFIVHTGGTTGPVKRIAHSDYAINSAIYQASIVPVNLYEGMSSLHVIPPIVALGLENTHLERYYNMKTHLISTYDKEEFVPFIKKYQPNLLVCVPSFTSKIQDSNPQLQKKDDLSYIKEILQGGEGFPISVDKSVDETLEKHGSTATSRLGFGQNEEFGGFTFNLHLDASDKRYGSSGVPLPGNEVIIYDLENDCELPYGKKEDGTYYIGELLVRGATLMQGYYGDDAKENVHSFKIVNGKKYFDTGDQAYLDEDGVLYWVTRNRRIIRTQDGKIFTNVLENIIQNFEEVLECCVVATPHPKIVKQASCHIVLKPEYQNLSKEEYTNLANDIKNRVESATKDMYSYYVPGTYEFRKEKLPYTTYGKVAFTKLEEENRKEYEQNGNQPLRKIRIR